MIAQQYKTKGCRVTINKLFLAQINFFILKFLGDFLFIYFFGYTS